MAFSRNFEIGLEKKGRGGGNYGPMRGMTVEFEEETLQENMFFVWEIIFKKCIFCITKCYFGVLVSVGSQAGTREAKKVKQINSVNPI